jgi:D-alanyl-D-alanine carboxypeptidase
MALRGLKSKIGRVAHVAVGACVALSTLTLLASPAEAHHWRHYRHYYHHYAAAYRHYAPARRAAPAVGAAIGPAFAALVVDANTGRTLFASHDNELRHPASLTKVMTLYMLFEQLESGKLTLDSQLTVSEHAAYQQPTKLGLAPGQSIRVEDAIKAIVTRSANDMAVAVAEAIGGSEENFAEMMTRKAHALGMSRTNYHNASGLPDDAQVTTAHDLTILARATEERFPRYFKYFSIESFEYAGEVIGNHDHLLGRVDGVDGIKTGYTRASGFNLLTSLHRDGRSLVAVVMGGRTAGARDRIMEGLLAEHIAEASSAGHTAPMIAETSAPEPVRVAQASLERTRPAAPLQLIAPRPAPVKAAPAVVAMADVPTPPARATLAAQPVDGEGDAAERDPPAPTLAAVIPAAKLKNHLAAVPAARAPIPPVVAARKTPAQLGWVKGPDAAPQAKLVATGKDAKALVAAVPAARPKQETSVAVRTEDTHPAAHDAWMIQIGATDDADKANSLLSRAKAQTHSTLASARPFTEKVQKGDGAFYRARFAGLDSVTAESACKSLKKAGFSCFPTQN